MYFTRKRALSHVKWFCTILLFNCIVVDAFRKDCVKMFLKWNYTSAPLFWFLQHLKANSHLCKIILLSGKHYPNAGYTYSKLLRCILQRELCTRHIVQVSSSQKTSSTWNELRDGGTPIRKCFRHWQSGSIKFFMLRPFLSENQSSPKRRNYFFIREKSNFQQKERPSCPLLCLRSLVAHAIPLKIDAKKNLCNLTPSRTCWFQPTLGWKIAGTPLGSKSLLLLVYVPPLLHAIVNSNQQRIYILGPNEIKLLLTLCCTPLG